MLKKLLNLRENKRKQLKSLKKKQKLIKLKKNWKLRRLLRLLHLLNNKKMLPEKLLKQQLETNMLELLNCNMSKKWLLLSKSKRDCLT
jgi:mRNA-degrading endonuclease YafQ of YafQ-DinJ toxin-antitoxin module